MTRKLLLLSLFSGIVILGIQAQNTRKLTSDLNAFRAGDQLVKQQVVYKDPGRSGENVLWDFSNLSAINDEYELSYRCLGDSSSIIGTEHRTMYYYSLTNDSLLLCGYENPTTLMRNQQPELLLKFPMVYQNEIKTYFSGQGKYCERLQLDAMGISETVADAYGVMVLPSRDTLRHVFRTHTVKWIAESTSPLPRKKNTNNPIIVVLSDSIDYRLANDSIIYGVETYRWYAKGYRYPIFETVKSIIQKKGEDLDYFDVAFFYPPQEHYYIENDENNLATLEEIENDPIINNDPWAGLTYNVYPNPVIYNMELDIYLPRSAQVRVQITGKMGQITLIENLGVLPEGISNRQICMASCISGEYVLNIFLDGEAIISKVILKR